MATILPIVIAIILLVGFPEGAKASPSWLMSLLWNEEGGASKAGGGGGGGSALRASSELTMDEKDVTPDASTTTTTLLHHNPHHYRSAVDHFDDPLLTNRLELELRRRREDRASRGVGVGVGTVFDEGEKMRGGGVAWGRGVSLDGERRALPLPPSQQRGDENGGRTRSGDEVEALHSSSVAFGRHEAVEYGHLDRRHDGHHRNHHERQSSSYSSSSSLTGRISNNNEHQRHHHRRVQQQQEHEHHEQQLFLTPRAGAESFSSSKGPNDGRVQVLREGPHHHHHHVAYAAERLALWESKAAVSSCWRSAVGLFKKKCEGRGAKTRGENEENSYFSSSPSASERSLMAMVLMNCQLETDGKPTHECDDVLPSSLSPSLGQTDAEDESENMPEGSTHQSRFASYFGSGGASDANSNKKNYKFTAFMSPSNEDMRRCVGSLHESLYTIYIQFRLHLDTLCFYVGEEVARERMERATRELHLAADVAASTVLKMEARAVEVEERMDHTTEVILRRFDEQLVSAQQHVQSVADLAVGIAERHAEALSTAGAHQESLKAMLEGSAAALESQRGMLAAILSSATNLSRHAELQHAKMASSNSEMLTILDRVYSLQRGIIDSLGFVQLVGVYATMVAACSLATLPRRTASARPWCVMATAAGAYGEITHIHGQHRRVEAEAFVMTLHSTPILGWALLPSDVYHTFNGLLRKQQRKHQQTHRQHVAQRREVANEDDNDIKVDEDTNDDDERNAFYSEGVGSSSTMSDDALREYAADIVTKLWRRAVTLVLAVIVAASALRYESADARLSRIVLDALRSVKAADDTQRVGTQSGPKFPSPPLSSSSQHRMGVEHTHTSSERVAITCHKESMWRRAFGFIFGKLIIGGPAAHHQQPTSPSGLIPNSGKRGGADRIIDNDADSDEGHSSPSSTIDKRKRRR